MPITSTVSRDVRKVLSQSKKPLYAWIGLGDFARKRVAALPQRAQLLTPNGVKAAAQAAGEQARSEYDRFARRGEQVVARTRRRPQTRRAEAKFEQALDAVDDVVEDAAENLPKRTRSATASARKAGRTATARKSPPRRS